MRSGRIRDPVCTLIMAGAMAACLSGCGLVESAQKLVPETEPVIEETTLQVREDGTWTETIIEKLDQGYYDTNELKALVDETVAAYNATEGEGSVTVDEFSVGENGVTLKMTYRDAAAYSGYNNLAAFQGSMLEAQMEGFLFLNDFREVADGVSSLETIPNEKPLSHKEYQVLVTDGSHVVLMPDKVRYVSSNAEVSDWKTVRPLQEEDANEGLVLPSSAVYKAEISADRLSETDREQGYLYIIYE